RHGLAAHQRVQPSLGGGPRLVVDRDDVPHGNPADVLRKPHEQQIGVELPPCRNRGERRARRIEFSWYAVFLIVAVAPDDGGERLFKARDIVGRATEGLIENAGWCRRDGVISSLRRSRGGWRRLRWRLDRGLKSGAQYATGAIRVLIVVERDERATE